jgi:hypothetical protein
MIGAVAGLVQIQPSVRKIKLQVPAVLPRQTKVGKFLCDTRVDKQRSTNIGVGLVDFSLPPLRQATTVERIRRKRPNSERVVVTRDGVVVAAKAQKYKTATIDYGRLVRRRDGRGVAIGQRSIERDPGRRLAPAHAIER